MLQRFGTLKSSKSTGELEPSKSSDQLEPSKSSDQLASLGTSSADEDGSKGERSRHMSHCSNMSADDKLHFESLKAGHFESQAAEILRQAAAEKAQVSNLARFRPFSPCPLPCAVARAVCLFCAVACISRGCSLSPAASRGCSLSPAASRCRSLSPVALWCSSAGALELECPARRCSSALLGGFLALPLACVFGLRVLPLTRTRGRRRRRKRNGCDTATILNTHTLLHTHPTESAPTRRMRAQAQMLYPRPGAAGAGARCSGAGPLPSARMTACIPRSLCCALSLGFSLGCSLGFSLGFSPGLPTHHGPCWWFNVCSIAILQTRIARVHVVRRRVRVEGCV